MTHFTSPPPFKVGQHCKLLYELGIWEVIAFHNYDKIEIRKLENTNGTLPKCRRTKIIYEEEIEPVSKELWAKAAEACIKKSQSLLQIAEVLRRRASEEEE